MPNRNNSLPPGLAELVNGPAMSMGAQQAPNVMMPQQPYLGLSSASMMPSYQLGGMVGPGGMPVRPDMGGMGGMGPGLAPQGSMQQNMSPEQIMPEVQRFLQQQPEQVQQMQAEIAQILQSGEMSMQDLMMVGQMAQTAAQNPSLYPQLRQIAIQRGLVDPGEISEEFDAGLVFLLALMGAVLQQGGAGQQGMAQQGMAQQGGMPSFRNGGPVPPRSGRAGEVVAKLHEGEYVIPADVVRTKGTEFFDRMLAANGQKSSRPKA
jgi:hypothetical protein